MARLAVTFTLVAMLAASTAVVLDAQGRGGGGRGGSGGGRGAGGNRGGGGGARFGVVVNFPAVPIPPSAGLSLNRPLGSQINGVVTSPPPGFGMARSPFDARRGTYTRLHRPGYAPYSFPYGNDYGFDPFYGSSYESTYDKMYRHPEPVLTEGTLLLEVTPATTLVFVDTAFVGNVGDLQARGVTLSAGRHFLDLEANGYEKKTIEITITAGEPLRYRYDMTPARRAEAVTAPPRVTQTMYAIPGCYGGNKPPVAAQLPRGCDIAKVRVIRPPALN
jgi:hypothetical protein